MDQLDFHNTNFETIKPPPRQYGGDIPILTELESGFMLWHGYLNNLPRHTKFTLGTKIDNLFTECIELALLAGYANKEEKRQFVKKLSAKFDALKFFLKILWEIGGLNKQKYICLSQTLAGIGRMIGGWQNLYKKMPPPINNLP